MVPWLRQHRRTLAGVLVLHLVAVALGRMNIWYLSDTPAGRFFVICRSMLYISLLTVWGASVRRRITAPTPRRLLIYLIGLMVAWMLLRTAKYILVADLNAKRYLWYLYYLPMLFIPVLAVAVSLTVGMPTSYTLPKWFYSGLVASGVLLLLVLTNDLHQWVFSFPPEYPVFSDNHYTYGPGYFVILSWILLCTLLAMGLLILKCRIPRSKTTVWLPMLPIGGLMLYSLLYVLGHPAIAYMSDMTIASCIWIVLIYECCIFTGLIPSNTRYRELFQAFQWPMAIVDKAGGPFLSTASGVALTQRAADEAPDPNYRQSQMDIPGGRVLWMEDVSRITTINARLQDINESLEERYILAEEEYRLGKEKARQTEANRLYDKMQQETAGQLLRMEQRLAALEKTNEEAEEQPLLQELMLRGAYFKRRNNLLFVAETQNRIDSAELSYCFKESCNALTLAGVVCSYQVLRQGDISLRTVIRLYDSFQQVLEVTLGQLEALVVQVDDQAMTITLTLATEEAFLFPSVFSVTVEDGAYLLTMETEQEGTT